VSDHARPRMPFPPSLSCATPLAPNRQVVEPPLIATAIRTCGTRVVWNLTHTCTLRASETEHQTQLQYLGLGSVLQLGLWLY